ncbi:MAG: hypothetical protein H0X39_18445 [Actinobacteria bacterium]|nr:hypothetical protein [Actinomycetota bacterium]
MTNLKSTHIAVATVAAVGLAAGGAAFAANKLHGSRQNANQGGLAAGTFVSSGTAAAGRSGSHEGHGPGDLAAAATYLGVTQSALVTSLQSGKTLAQVADATSGKSSAGLIDALVAAEKTELAAAVKAGQLTQAQADSISSDLKTRVTSQVNDTHTGDDGDHHGRGGFGPGGPGGFGPGGFGPGGFGPGGPAPAALSSGSNSTGGTHI